MTDFPSDVYVRLGKLELTWIELGLAGVQQTVSGESDLFGDSYREPNDNRASEADDKLAREQCFGGMTGNIQGEVDKGKDFCCSLGLFIMLLFLFILSGFSFSFVSPG